MSVIIGLLLAGLLLLSISLERAYAAVPAAELKRRVREQDVSAARLHKAAIYGESLRVLLWILVALSGAGFFVFTAHHTQSTTAFFLSAILLWLGFVWLSNKEAKALGLWFAKLLAPAFGWILQYAHGPISHVQEIIARYHPVTVHTGLYDKQDLLELLNSQNVQADNRVTQAELDLAFQALTFGDKTVGDYVTPRRIVKSVSVEDDIGPILMSELHKSGFSRFPVYEKKKDNIVGTLFLKDLVKTKATGKVKMVMRKEVCYVHEEQSLYDALQAIIKTRHHLLIVVNSFEEFVGVLTIEDIFEQIVGQPIQDEFDQYDSLRAVAGRAAAKEHEDHVEAPTSVATEEEVIE